MSDGAVLRQARKRAGLTQVEPETLEKLLRHVKVRPSLVLQARRDDVLRAAERHKVENVRVFGSAVYGADTVDSDIDLLVHLADDATPFDLIGFHQQVEQVLGSDVDVVSDRGTGRAMDRVRLEAVAL